MNGWMDECFKDVDREKDEMMFLKKIKLKKNIIIKKHNFIMMASLPPLITRKPTVYLIFIVFSSTPHLLHQSVLILDRFNAALDCGWWRWSRWWWCVARRRLRRVFGFESRTLYVI